MARSTEPLVLAVDGGGTRCRLAVRGKDVGHKVEVGAANVSTDFEAALEQLLRGLEVLASDTGLSVTELTRAPAYLGLAGITGRTIAERLAAALPFESVRIEDDRAAALRGALGPQDGMVAHCGTGSFVASQKSGANRFAGGWGSVLGDQASAQWVGRCVLSKVLDSVDGVAAPSQLSEYLLSRWGGAAEIVRAAAEMTPAQFGELAPLVTEHAERDDAMAVAIMREGADYLADRMTKLGWVAGLPICLTGGIGPLYAKYLPSVLQGDLMQPVGDPLSGALALARAFQKEIEHEHN
ncbi:ATPase [Ruegeria sp. ANG-S4]|uniref:BadF/BadG/BcrA/BcrD ATPase family protein n=1 Tax=Ruegeria sp. ANG-S4 TaxID=1577904 RepID=UPI0005804DC1|nr:BadF/BadG/BcrA/BcrD ATPase family protein [Ruegeria sp. ANG-S4]KIC45830.1 ATPase [Ruegeria sp. ANG-S4]